jgi:hypothetical protein
LKVRARFRARVKVRYRVRANIMSAKIIGGLNRRSIDRRDTWARKDLIFASRNGQVVKVRVGIRGLR